MPRSASRAHTHHVAVAGALAALGFAGACAITRAGGPSADPGRANSLVGTWDLVSLSTRWPDGRVTEPWGAAPVGRLTYSIDGAMAATLMDARRNQADGRAVPEELQGSAAYAAYYGDYAVDVDRRVVTHRVRASLRASEAGTIERRYRLSGDTLALTADALYQGAQVAHTLVWRRATARRR